jgi:carbon storage regulator
MLMLILTRRISESVMIGPNIRIQVLSHKGNQVKLGIHAPHEIAVHREEVFERIQRGGAAPDLAQSTTSAARR